MREFFKGWRRKVGCVTLVMALASLGLWTRSFQSDDAITISIVSRTHMVRSWTGLVSWYSWNVLKEASPIPRWTSGRALPRGDTWEAFVHQFPHEEYASAIFEIGNQ